MKKLLPPFITAILLFGSVAAQTIPDGNFDSWNYISWSGPQGYNNSNVQAIIQRGAAANVTQLPPWTTGEGFAVQLQTEAVAGDTIPAYITNSVNNPLQGVGGVPYSGQPTGIEVWYNYTSSTVSKDSGAMVVVFKKSGSIIGIYKCPLPPTSTNYPLKTFTFSPALAEAADTVIFAATSSIDILGNKKNGFAGSTLAISEVEFTSGTAQPADLNWDFDPWVNDTAFDPTGWEANYPGVSRSTDANTGNTYALKLVTSLNPNNSTDSASVAIATTGRLTNNGVVGGYPYAESIDTLEFYYAYTPAKGSSDIGFALVQFFEKDSIPHQDGITLSPSATFTGWKLPINLGSFVPDTTNITFLSSFALGSLVPLADLGSTLLVDGVEFTSQPTGVKPVLLADNSILIYPNPASNQINVSCSQANIDEVRLTNILGQMVLDKTYAQGMAGLKENVDVSILTPGVYFITIKAGSTTSTGKILVTR